MSATSCGSPGSPQLFMHPEASPTTAETRVPQATELSGGRVLLSWERPLSSGGYAFEMAVKEGTKWSAVRTIAKGPDFSMFTADLPAVATLAGSRLFAYWEVKDQREGDRYATTIKAAISNNEGRTWTPAATPYTEGLSGQHSFISWFGTDSGVGLVWLDASTRSQVRHDLMHSGMHPVHSDLGAVGLRYAALNSQGEIEHQQFVEPITCECCPTSAASTSRGPIIVYRGRQEPLGTIPSEVHDDRPTVRDIYVVRQENGIWHKPILVHKDNWIINACPDNGPAVDASGNQVVVAWWTRSHNQPKVQLAFSSDSGESFGPAFRVDSATGEGQVTVALLPGGTSAIVGWLENGETWARYVSRSGAISKPVALGSSPHHSRLPHWMSDADGSVLAAWTSKKNDQPHLELSRIWLKHRE